MQGWVSIHRKIMNNPVWQDPLLLKLWMLCLLEASHKEHEQLVGRQVVKLQPGEFVTGRFSLAESYNKGMKKSEKVNERTLWRWLKGLEDGGFLTIKSTTKYSVISINNWSLYQNNDQQMSNKCPTNVQQVSTNNNGNKGNKLFSSNNTDSDFSQIMTFYQQNLQKGVSESPFNLQLLSQWYEEFGDDLLLAAMKVAAKQEAKGTAFVEGVLKNWREAGVRTIDDARNYELKFKQQKQGKMKVIKGGKQNAGISKHGDFEANNEKYDFGF